MAARRPRRPTQESAAVRRLRARLTEAEETLAAIRDGHVEALVVHTPNGEQVFTLKSADQPYRLMVEQMREGALTLSADGMVLYCNRCFGELVQQSPEQIVGQSIFDVIVADDHARIRAMLAASSYRDECHVRMRNTAVRPVQLSSTALSIDDIPTVAVVVSDLTQERTERGLRESNRLKDEFLATLSHELRTPLNVILGWTRMLLSGQLPESTKRRALETIDRNAQAQAQLVNDLIDVSRMTTGKIRLDMELIPLAPALESAIESVRPSAQAKGLVIERSWPSADVHVLADAMRFQQILWNIFSNAVKFTPAGGRITVRTRRIDASVGIEIADSGSGIAPSFLPHVFGRFRQADSGVTRSHGGLGLGLSIVHDLVRLHGGDVLVKSAGAGKGTTVLVTLPLNENALDAVRDRGRRHLPNLHGQTVMLVEDHEDSRELLTRDLREAGAIVIPCHSAAAAIEKLEQVRPTVLVTDIGMPGEDGYSLMRRVRAHRNAAIRSLPAIAVSAYATVADRAQSLSAGFAEHLAKPIESSHVAAAVRAVADRSPVS